MEVIQINIDKITPLQILEHFNNPRKEQMLEYLQQLTQQEITIQKFSDIFTPKQFRVVKQSGNGFVLVMVSDTKENKRYKFLY